MNVYVAETGIVLSGKAWEIKRKLYEYSLKHDLVIEWITSLETQKKNNKLVRIK